MIYELFLRVFKVLAILFLVFQYICGILAFFHNNVLYILILKLNINIIDESYLNGWTCFIFFMSIQYLFCITSDF